MTGVKGQVAVLYRALRPMPVPDVKRHELWELAVILGLDEDDDGLTERRMANVPERVVKAPDAPDAPMRLRSLA